MKIEPVSAEDLLHLGIDEENNIYWKGKPIVTKKTIDLSSGQKFWAILVAVSAVVAGLVESVNGGHEFACKQHWITSGCASLEAASPGVGVGSTGCSGECDRVE